MDIGTTAWMNHYPVHFPEDILFAAAKRFMGLGCSAERTWKMLPTANTAGPTCDVVKESSAILAKMTYINVSLRPSTAFCRTPNQRKTPIRTGSSPLRLRGSRVYVCLWCFSWVFASDDCTTQAKGTRSDWRLVLSPPANEGPVRRSATAACMHHSLACVLDKLILSCCHEVLFFVMNRSLHRPRCCESLLADKLAQFYLPWLPRAPGIFGGI